MRHGIGPHEGVDSGISWRWRGADDASASARLPDAPATGLSRGHPGESRGEARAPRLRRARRVSRDGRTGRCGVRLRGPRRHDLVLPVQREPGAAPAQARAARRGDHPAPDPVEPRQQLHPGGALQRGDLTGRAPLRLRRDGRDAAGAPGDRAGLERRLADAGHGGQAAARAGPAAPRRDDRRAGLLAGRAAARRLDLRRGLRGRGHRRPHARPAGRRPARPGAGAAPARQRGRRHALGRRPQPRGPRDRADELRDRGVRRRDLRGPRAGGGDGRAPSRPRRRADHPDLRARDDGPRGHRRCLERHRHHPPGHGRQALRRHLGGAPGRLLQRRHVPRVRAGDRRDARAERQGLRRAHHALESLQPQLRAARAARREPPARARARARGEHLPVLRAAELVGGAAARRVRPRLPGLGDHVRRPAGRDRAVAGAAVPAVRALRAAGRRPVGRDRPRPLPVGRAERAAGDGAGEADLRRRRGLAARDGRRRRVVPRLGLAQAPAGVRRRARRARRGGAGADRHGPRAADRPQLRRPARAAVRRHAGSAGEARPRRHARHALLGRGEVVLPADLRRGDAGRRRPRPGARAGGAPAVRPQPRRALPPVAVRALRARG